MLLANVVELYLGCIQTSSTETLEPLFKEARLLLPLFGIFRKALKRRGKLPSHFLKHEAVVTIHCLSIRAPAQLLSPRHLNDTADNHDGIMAVV